MVKSENSKWFKIRKILQVCWPFFIAILVFIGTRFAAGHSTIVEKDYSESVYPVISWMLSAVSHLIPFSIWDIFWVFVLLFFSIGLLMTIFRKITPGWYIVWMLQLVAVLYSVFYISWGFNYFRPGIEKRLEWEPIKTDTIFFQSVLDTIITQTNKNYISVSSKDYPKFDSLIENSYKRNSKALGIKYPNGVRRPKNMIFSSFFSKVGVSGYFGPFFNEVHINHYLLPMDYPAVLAHEKAHQFGFTSESEANFAAFVICTKSGDQRLRYSGYQALLMYFLKDASKLKTYHNFLNMIDKRVINDLRYRRKYYMDLENKRLSDIQTSANDIYLKVNKVEKGVMNYNQVVNLVVGWYYNSEKQKEN